MKIKVCNNPQALTTKHTVGGVYRINNTLGITYLYLVCECMNCDYVLVNLDTNYVVPKRFESLKEMDMYNPDDVFVDCELVTKE